jgi:hypothetical protein
MAMNIPYLGIEGHDHTCVVGGLNDHCPIFIGKYGPYIPEGQSSAD